MGGGVGVGEGKRAGEDDERTCLAVDGIDNEYDLLI